MLHERLMAPEAEQAVLGCLFLAPAWAIAEVFGILPKSAVFVEPRHRALFGVMQDLWLADRPLELPAVFEALRDRDLVEEAGGAAYVASLLEGAGTAAPSSAPHYANQVAEAKRRRVLCDAAAAIDQAARAAESADGALEAAEKLLFGLRPEQQAVEATGVRVLTGIPSLDDLTAGFGPGELVIVGAQTSAGKTALAGSVARNVALGAGRQPARPVLFVSREMSVADIAARFLCGEARISTIRARRGTLTGDEWGRLWQAAATVAEWPIWLDDRHGRTVPDIARLARDLAREVGQPLGLVVVDYLGLLDSPEKAENETVRIGQISRGLKMTAGELGLPVLALAQLSRTAHGSEIGLRHLRGSGSQEQDADIVLLLERGDQGANGEVEEELMAPLRRLKVEKNRGGPLGDAYLYLAGRYVRFDAVLQGRWEARIVATVPWGQGKRVPTTEVAGMVRLADAVRLAVTAMEAAEASAKEREASGGVRRLVRDADGRTVEAVTGQDGTAGERAARCGRCFDDGLIHVAVDGANSRVRCSCAAAEPFATLAVSYAELFGVLTPLPGDAPSPAAPPSRYEAEPAWEVLA